MSRESFACPEDGTPEDSNWDQVVVVLEVGTRTPPVDRAAAVRAGLVAGDGLSSEQRR